MFGDSLAKFVERISYHAFHHVNQLSVAQKVLYPNFLINASSFDQQSIIYLCVCSKRDSIRLHRRYDSLKYGEFHEQLS